MGDGRAKRHAAGLLIAFACTGVFAGQPTSRTLTLNDRVGAQAAIERVYYSHQLGATKPFEQAIPRAALEAKVHNYLEQTAALASLWKTPVTDEMLRREVDRMAQGTKMPERLLELYAALGNDPFLIKECLARATLVDRMARELYAWDPAIHVEAKPERTWDDWWATERLSLRSEPVPVVATEGDRLPMPAMSTLPCSLDDTWAPTDPGAPRGREGHSAVWTGDQMVVWGGDDGTPSLTRTGGRFDPVISRWASTSLTGAPSARDDQTSIWTGSLMVVWGGDDNQNPPFNTGGRYDPATDSWSPTSMVGAPSARTHHTAVWTGSQMVVWGGTSDSSGGRYDPATDGWLPTSQSGAPSPRSRHTAVWTGTSMLVWGGSADSTGGRYDPANDSWAVMSTVNAPSPRSRHTAVWTGTLMVVWGGGAPNVNTGGRYNPANDSWTKTSATGAPSARSNHTAVWTGSLMVVWGGGSAPNVNTGGRYNPATDAWTATSTIGAPVARSGHTAVWAGDFMIVWGGSDHAIFHAQLDTGGQYDPVTDLWKPTAAAPSARQRHSAIWTGSFMVLWGGDGRDVYDTGGRYDPATDTWAPTATTAAPSARFNHTAVWTGDAMVVWGGEDIVAGSEHNLDSGGRYDPATDNWTPMSATNAPSARIGHTAVWTGSVMVVWGGSGDSTGGRYNPATDTWAPTSTSGAPSARSLHTFVWTGDRAVVWGGRGLASEQLNTGGVYDPASDAWTPTATSAAPSARDRHAAVWTGSRMVVWGGFDGASGLDTGGLYDPAGDGWTATSTTGAPPARYDHTAVATGTLVVVWGGGDFGSPMNTGGRYNVATDSWSSMSTTTAPSARVAHTGVWTGSALIVWGGNDIFGGTIFNTGGVYALVPPVDNDGDGTTVCQGDCDDALPSVHPGAPELCDGLDNNCNGEFDEDVNGVDSDGDGVRNACDNCGLEANAAQSDFDDDGQGDACDLDDGVIYVYSTDRDYREWQSEAGYTSWNSYRGSLTVLRATGRYTQSPGSNPLAAHDCGVSGTAVFDPLVPDPGEVAFTLVTGVMGGVESGLGTDSAGVARANANPCP